MEIWNCKLPSFWQQCDPAPSLLTHWFDSLTFHLPPLPLFLSLPTSIRSTYFGSLWGSFFTSSNLLLRRRSIRTRAPSKILAQSMAAECKLARLLSYEKRVTKSATAAPLRWSPFYSRLLAAVPVELPHLLCPPSHLQRPPERQIPRIWSNLVRLFHPGKLSSTNSTPSGLTPLTRSGTCLGGGHVPAVQLHWHSALPLITAGLHSS